jgi:hypothetical protein
MSSLMIEEFMLIFHSLFRNCGMIEINKEKRREITKMKNQIERDIKKTQEETDMKIIPEKTPENTEMMTKERNRMTEEKKVGNPMTEETILEIENTTTEERKVGNTETKVVMKNMTEEEETMKKDTNQENKLFNKYGINSNKQKNTSRKDFFVFFVPQGSIQ